MAAENSNVEFDPIIELKDAFANLELDDAGYHRQRAHIVATALRTLHVLGDPTFDTQQRPSPDEEELANILVYPGPARSLGLIEDGLPDWRQAKEAAQSAHVDSDARLNIASTLTAHMLAEQDGFRAATEKIDDIGRIVRAAAAIGSLLSPEQRTNSIERISEKITAFTTHDLDAQSDPAEHEPASPEKISELAERVLSDKEIRFASYGWGADRVCGVGWGVRRGFGTSDTEEVPPRAQALVGAFGLRLELRTINTGYRRPVEVIDDLTSDEVALFYVDIPKGERLALDASWGRAVLQPPETDEGVRTVAMITFKNSRLTDDRPGNNLSVITMLLPEASRDEYMELFIQNPEIATEIAKQSLYGPHKWAQFDERDGASADRLRPSRHGLRELNLPRELFTNIATAIRR